MTTDNLTADQREAWLWQATERGKAAASAVLHTNDGQAVDLHDIEPPAPLSGEWAGESIPELAHDAGIDLAVTDLTEDDLNDYEDAYYAAYEVTLRTYDH